ncbi:hypothetical protein JB92DRAFT_2997182 [Gautieria morchelliformis]|nr:hypothetical protein JB92DRAFT_2997182 [Gautieria morchelliformis]
MRFAGWSRFNFAICVLTRRQCRAALDPRTHTSSIYFRTEVILNASCGNRPFCEIVKYKECDEVGIGKFFSSEPLASDPKNHCVRLLDVLEVPEYEGMFLLVMPILRHFNQPKIFTFGEAVEFF